MHEPPNKPLCLLLCEQCTSKIRIITRIQWHCSFVANNHFDINLRKRQNYRQYPIHDVYKQLPKNHFHILLPAS